MGLVTTAVYKKPNQQLRVYEEIGKYVPVMREIVSKLQNAFHERRYIASRQGYRYFRPILILMQDQIERAMMLAENQWSEKVGVEARGKTPTIRSES